MQTKPKLQQNNHKTTQKKSKNEPNSLVFSEKRNSNEILSLKFIRLIKNLELFDPNKYFIYKVTFKANDNSTKTKQFTCIGNLGVSFQIVADNSNSKILIINKKNEKIVSSFESIFDLYYFYILMITKYLNKQKHW